MKQTILFIFGTRPEAIKLAPLIRVFKNKSDLYNVITCVTSQHKSMLHQILDTLKIAYEYNLDVMQKNQGLADLTSRLIKKLNPILSNVNPNLVFVQGDTTSSLVGALVSYYNKIPVAHVEAGLRSHNKYSPYPEEINRILISNIANFHFTPTEVSKQNLLNEGIDEHNIWVTGNTVIDSHMWMKNTILVHEDSYKEYYNSLGITFNKKIILVTGHRRENIGKNFENICNALKRIVAKNDVEVVFPVHLNPKVRGPASDMIGNTKGIYLLDPLDYDNFLFLLNKCYMVITDSGGIQEEAPSFNKPVLITRENTERPEGIRAMTSLLVGTDQQNIEKYATKLLINKSLYNKMASANNPYGIGDSSDTILNIINNYFQNNF